MFELVSVSFMFSIFAAILYVGFVAVLHVIV